MYQVTRPGHEHCDVTEGVLLDITPLVVDGKKLVTLYDKDLTEGVNLLIGRYSFLSCRVSVQVCLMAVCRTGVVRRCESSLSSATAKPVSAMCA